MRSEFPRKKSLVNRRNLFLALLFLSTSALSALALLLPLSVRASTVPLKVGDVAPLDIVAPRSISYESEVLTEVKRQTAANAVSAVYAPPDSTIAREQIIQLRALLAYINSVRADEYATPEQKIIDLAAIQDVNFSPEIISQLVNLPDSNWEMIQQESIVVLEQVMRNTIREDRLEDARRNIPAMVSFSLTEEQADLVAKITTAFVVPNSLYSEALTEAQRQEARKNVQPVMQSFVANEMIVLSGQVIDSADLEALHKLGLLQPQTTWKDRLRVIIIVLVCFTFIALYLQHRQDLLDDMRGMLIIAFFFLIFLFAARIIIPQRTVIPFLFPIAGYSLLISALLSAPPARLLSLPLSVLAAYNLGGGLELTLYYILTSMFGVLVLKNAQRITSFFWAGTAISGVGASIILVFRLGEQTTDLFGLLTLLAATMVYSLASISVAVLLQFFLAQTLGLTTTLQLIEISRPDHPLLQFILRNSPGTYQHSLQIANLAEQAAELINADTLLTRVGSLYHDAGKALNPHYFIENQLPGSHNPHEDITPQESAAVIIRHVPDGEELAKKYKLPQRILDFVLEHHGTLITRYQYSQALDAAGGDNQQIDIEKFRYPGPRPQSVETALVMLADGVEARTRAERPKNEAALRALVEGSVNERLDARQLDDTNLTMKDINVVIESFISTLKGVYHPRIKYPELNEKSKLLQQDQTENIK